MANVNNDATMAMPDEDAELKELVIQSLEENGVLAKIRAQLRASVFLALDESSTLQKSKPAISKKLLDYFSTRNGRLVACLVHEFLKYLELENTLAVYNPDSYFGQLYSYEDRQSLAKDLGFKLDNVVSLEVPLLDLLVSNNAPHADSFTTGKQPQTFTESDSHRAFSATLATPSSVPRVNTTNTEVKEHSSMPDSLTPVHSDNEHSGLNEYKDEHDPFFDDPIRKLEEFSSKVNKSASAPSNAGKYQKDSYLDKDKSSSISNNDKDTQEAENKSKINASDSLGSLRNAPPIVMDNFSMQKLPPLDMWRTLALSDTNQEPVPSQQKQTSAANLKNDKFRDDDYEEDFQSSASIHTDVKTGTEQSIEEDIDDNLSGAVDDLLSNDVISEADDLTTDHTISHISNREADYLESLDD